MEDKKKIVGLKFIYQKNNESFNVYKDHFFVGREHEGAEILNKITCSGKPVISRKHCSFTLKDNKYFIKDEGSLNGTFHGIDKKDCKIEIAIEDKEIIFLGKEMFFVEYIYETKTSNINEDINDLKKDDKPRQYVCNQGCGYKTDKYVEICPKCLTLNSLIEI